MSSSKAGRCPYDDDHFATPVLRENSSDKLDRIPFIASRYASLSSDPAHSVPLLMLRVRSDTTTLSCPSLPIRNLKRFAEDHRVRGGCSCGCLGVFPIVINTLRIVRVCLGAVHTYETTPYQLPPLHLMGLRPTDSADQAAYLQKAFGTFSSCRAWTSVRVFLIAAGC